ncbi:MAG: hypothetical protein RLZZ292_2705, partial [Bacteroidota bacterium]
MFNMKKQILFNLLFSASALLVNANTAIKPVTTPSVEVVAPNLFVTLEAGTIVTVALMQEVDATTLSVGNAVYFEVYNDVDVNGKVVIKAG